MSEISDGVDLKALIEAAKKATPGPWLYRPYEYDDWGFVRGGPLDEDGKLWPVAIAKAGKHLTGDQYDSHRAAKTDPCGPNAAFIALANPSTVAAMAEELMALREAVKPFAALAKLDRGHRPTDNLMSIYATDGVAKVSYGDLYRLGALLEPAHV